MFRCDIKPDNIFLARHADVADPVPKVLDFGISKLEARGTKHASLTRAGAAIGTPMYMSYEQLLGADDIDGRTDVYAFGVVLYEAVTGRAPYNARSYAEWLLHFAAPPASPKTHRPEIPTALDRLVMWCLERDRDKRVPSMEALIRELEPFATALSFRNLLTVPSQVSVLPSKLGATPAEAVAELLERIQASNTPRPAGSGESSGFPGYASASASAELTRIHGRKRSWLIAGGVALLCLIALIFLRPRGRQVAEFQRETTPGAATHSRPEAAVSSTPNIVAPAPSPKPRLVTATPALSPKPAAVLPAAQPTAADVQPSHPQRVNEPRPHESGHDPALRKSAPNPAASTPSRTAERPARSGPDWGIY